MRPQFLRLAEGYLQELLRCLFLAIFTSEGLSSPVRSTLAPDFAYVKLKLTNETEVQE